MKPAYVYRLRLAELADQVVPRREIGSRVRADLARGPAKTQTFVITNTGDDVANGIGVTLVPRRRSFLLHQPRFGADWLASALRMQIELIYRKTSARNSVSPVASRAALAAR